MLEIRETSAYAEWFAALRDRVAKARIDIRIRRLSQNNPGDVFPLAMASLSSESITARAIGFISSSKERQLSSFLLEGVKALSRRILDRPKTLLAIFRGSQ